MKNWKTATWALLLVLALAVPAAWAQQQKDPRLNPPVVPLPPITPGESSSRAAPDDPAPNPQNAVKPDESPLSGAEEFSLGTSGGGRSFVTPSIRYSQFGNNGRSSTTSSNNWGTSGTIAGNLTLQRIAGRTMLGIDYATGGLLFSDSHFGGVSFHRLGISEQMSWRRMTILLADSMVYLPESSYGAGGIGGISTGGFGGLGGGSIGTGLGGGLLGGGLGGGLVPGITPNQSIVTGAARRISNVAVGQMQYMIGPRSTMTASGVYGTLRFLDSGFIDSNNYQFMTGYSYRINAADSIGVVYSLSLFRFTGFPQSSNFHNFNLTYGRRLTGRLALRLSGGPQIGTFTNPVSGPGSRVRWSLRSSLLYSFRNSNLALNYSHSASSGSGVLVGADSDRIDGSINRQLTRMWSGGLMFGYARNSSIRQLNTLPVGRSLNTWNAGLQLNRPLTRKANLSFTYHVTGQSANNPVGCVGLTCGRLPLRHYLSMAISWGFGPYTID